MASKVPDDERTYICVKQQKTTGFDWYTIKNGSKSEDILLKGNIPEYEVPSSIYHGDNTFICYGEYEDDTYVDGKLSKVFRVEEWEIKYPVKRAGIRPEIINPSYGTNVWDYID